MGIQVRREKFDPEAGQYQYHLQFKPVEDDREVRASVSVEVAFSISENGELAELSFTLPKVTRNQHAMKYLTLVHLDGSELKSQCGGFESVYRRAARQRR